MVPPYSQSCDPATTIASLSLSCRKPRPWPCSGKSAWWLQRDPTPHPCHSAFTASHGLNLLITQQLMTVCTSDEFTDCCLYSTSANVKQEKIPIITSPGAQWWSVPMSCSAPSVVQRWRFLRDETFIIREGEVFALEKLKLVNIWLDQSII